MKILVIDNMQKHLDAALQTLVGHDVTSCLSYDEALELLKQEWDAVLCDLMMPAGRDAQGPKGYQFIGQEMSVGWSLALVAAKRGAKYVAVVSDMDHHSHPASALLDRLNDHLFVIDGATVLMTNQPKLVGINGTECRCDSCDGSGNKKGDNERKCCWCKGTGTSFTEHGKDWGKILNKLLGIKEKEELIVW